MKKNHFFRFSGFPDFRILHPPEKWIFRISGFPDFRIFDISGFSPGTKKTENSPKLCPKIEPLRTRISHRDQKMSKSGKTGNLPGGKKTQMWNFTKKNGKYSRFLNGRWPRGFFPAFFKSNLDDVSEKKSEFFTKFLLQPMKISKIIAQIAGKGKKWFFL